MREVTTLMGFKFPNMFQDKGSSGKFSWFETFFIPTILNTRRDFVSVRSCMIWVRFIIIIVVIVMIVMVGKQSQSKILLRRLRTTILLRRLRTTCLLADAN